MKTFKVRWLVVDNGYTYSKAEVFDAVSEKKAVEIATQIAVAATGFNKSKVQITEVKEVK